MTTFTIPRNIAELSHSITRDVALDADQPRQEGADVTPPAATIAAVCNWRQPADRPGALCPYGPRQVVKVFRVGAIQISRIADGFHVDLALTHM